VTLDLVRSSVFVRQHAGRTFVLKIGGACLARPRRLRAFARQVAAVQALGSRILLVHGAGPQVSERQRALGETPHIVGGRRVTTPLALEALTDCARELGAVLATALRAEGASALCVDAVASGAVRADRRLPVVTDEGPVDFGLVGDVVGVDAAFLAAALAEEGLVVLSPPVAGSGKGEPYALNVNADTIAAEAAIALGAAKLVLITDAPGILSDPADGHSAIGAMTLDELRGLSTSGALRGGMAVKATAVERALTGGVERVHVVDGRREDALLVELYTAHGSGTLVTLAGAADPIEEPNVQGVGA